MSIIVNTGTTLTVTDPAGLTISADGTVTSGGLLNGSGTIVGGFTLLNQGTISADVAGDDLAINTGTLTNQGTVFANNGSLTIESSVSVTNLSGGTLTGGVWEASGTGVLSLLTGLIVTDSATIILDGVASAFDSGTGTPQPIDDTLTTIGTSGKLNILGGRDFQAGTSLVVNGTVTLGGGTLSAPTNGLTIGATGHIVGFGTVDPGTPVVDNGTIEAAGGTLTVPQAGNISGIGTLQVDPGASLVLQALGSYAQSIVNNGTIDLAFGGFTDTTAISGPYSGTGGFLIQGGFDSADRTILELPSGVSGNVEFDTNFGELLVDVASTFNGTVSGFGNNSTIVLSGLGNAEHASLIGNLLDLTNSVGGVVQTMTLNAGSMDYSSATFHVTENTLTSQATLKVTGAAPAACFAEGTRITTRAGDVPVEHLAAGDIVSAHFTGMVPVVWVGHRCVDCRHHPEPSKVWPVRISAHAFAPGEPSRDLWLSPDHAVFVNNVLIPVKFLINGKTITQVTVDEVTYYHVELAEHDVVRADGMPAESYLENDDRASFDNAGETVLLHPDFGMRRWEAFGCAELVMTGEKLAAVVARLRARIPKDRRATRSLTRVA